MIFESNSSKLTIQPDECDTMVSITRHLAQRVPDRIGFRFLEDGEDAEQDLTYGELDHKARLIAAAIGDIAPKGSRVILPYHPGLDFIAALFGCFYAGAAAVPTFAPMGIRKTERLEGILIDCNPRILCTTGSLLSISKAALEKVPKGKSIQVLITDKLTGTSNNPGEFSVQREDIAFLQYTSGSTTTPRGVMVSHGNLLANLSAIKQAYNLTGKSVGVSWVPPHHDMGLVGGILSSVYSGFENILMSPPSFLQRPYRWLKAISKYQATYSFAPNFAYELCVQKITPAEKKHLDLSSWVTAINGAEMIRTDTLDRFTGYFSTCGFSKKNHNPSYGLAECTVLVSYTPAGKLPVSKKLLRHQLEKRKVREPNDEADENVFKVVGCGVPIDNHRVMIVDPGTLKPCSPGEIGEIWISGPCVARGYWNQPQLTKELLQARLGDADDRTYLRTGDLGFLENGEIFVTGRIKELIIIQGTNYYPQDIETIAQECHEGLRPGAGAAFSIEYAGEERIVLVQEIEKQYYEFHICKEIEKRIKASISRHFDLKLHDIVIVHPWKIPRTTSGKIQRSKCKQQYLQGEFKAIKERKQKTKTEPGTKAEPGTSEKPGLDKNKIQQWLTGRIARGLEVEPQAVDIETPLFEFGLGSKEVFVISGELETLLNRKLVPTILYDYPDIKTISAYLAGDVPGEIEKPQAAVTSPSLSEPLAIIGMACRFPGASHAGEFWKNLLDGKDCITEIPAERWDWREYYGDPLEENNKTNIKWGGFIEGIDWFDPLFFGINPREAQLMDPQQRLLMTYAWKAIEDAGYSTQSLSGTRTGIFVGTMGSGYSELLSRANVKIEGYTSTGMVPSVGPNRMSFFINLHGPSEPIETACSSSLVAVHRAIESIQTGACDMAIVGGVNTIVTPDAHISFNKAGMLSEDGRCKTFSDKADGYGRGEGVGMIFLKKLKEAEQAGDHIYGVIRSSAENHGGRVNTLTAPNPRAQAELLKAAYTKAGIDPRNVTYIETHGTGTKLGDPIEINGLKTAFRELYQASGDPRVTGAHCGLGSVKTNIGHLELAAGIAGVIKVLLQLQHKTLVKSLHCDTVNPLIDLKESPFYIVRESKEWKTGQDSQGKDLPRRAGVSSFGFGGANAHVVIEEYTGTQSVKGEGQKESQATITPENPTVIVLSARKAEQLSQLVEELLTDTREKQFTDSHLADIAYTLQVGREAMAERLAVIVGSIEELREKLQAFLDGRENIENLYRGQVKRNKDTLEVFAGDEELQEAVEKWIHRKKFSKLLQLWVKGLNIDWNKLYDGIKPQKPRRISLPTYPFARERYWVPEDRVNRGQTIEDETQGPGTGVRFIHPLLHQNTSDFFEQRFSSTFTGQEFFLADHRVKGQRVLPGVAYLEMARAAVEQAAGALEQGQTGIRLKNVVWARPITLADRPVRVHIGLFPGEGDNGQVAYEIYSDPKTDDEEPIVHSRGTAVLSPMSGGPPVPTLDLPGLQAQCCQDSLSPHQCYDTFKAMGIDYGPAQQGIEKVFVGPRGDQVLAKLSLPAPVFYTRDQFVLHPSLMDSALQASIGLLNGPGFKITPGSNIPLKPALPFALQELEIFAGCTPAMWALVQTNNGSAAGDRVQKLDIDLCNEQGRICVRMKGFSVRVLEGEIQTDTALLAVPSETPVESLAGTGGSVGTIMLTPVWDAIPPEKCRAFPSPTDHLVIVGGTEDNRNAIQRLYPNAAQLEIHSKDTIDAIAEKLPAHDSVSPIDHILWIAPYHPAPPALAEGKDNFTAADELIEEQSRGVMKIFRMIKALLSLGYGSRDLGWTIITTGAQSIGKNDPVSPAHAGIHGLVGSLAKEYPNWKIRLIDLEADGEWPTLDIFSLPANPQGNARVYRNRQWYRQQLLSLHCPQPERKLYRPGGVYVVIGGAGGIGEVWTEYMIRTYQARVIWIDRRQEDAVIKAKLARLAVPGPTPLYITADATDRQALHHAYEEIKRRYDQIHGVVHSVIVLSDQSLAKMEEEQFQAVLSAKVDVSVRIAQVFQKEPLDFVLFFSSIIAFVKNPGQSNYASGSTFKDAFAHWLSHQWPCAVKVINWGYWGSLGIVASEAYRQRMTQLGIGSIEPPEAMAALEILLAGQIDQMALLKTTKPLVMEGINPGESITVFPENFPSIVNKKFLLGDARKAQSAERHEPCAMRLPPGRRRQKEMDELLSRLLWGQLQSMGLFREKTSILTDLKAKTGLLDLYRCWLEESTAVLASQGYLQKDGDSCHVIDTAPPDIDALWKEWDQKKIPWLEDPNIKARVVLVEATMRVLPGILTGKRLATDIMFPDSSLELVEGIYQNSPAADYFNEVLADTAAAYTRERLQQDAAAGVRILEIGAGTGGTSAMIFKKLAPYREQILEYCYTDISKAFLMHAEKEFGPGNPYLTYQMFNVEAPPDGQLITAGGYDIVIAANVLHATKNIRQTLRNAKAALKKNGLFLLNELSGNALFTHLTFGLLEGWWRYEDPELRIPGCPALSPRTWQEVLEHEGFRSVFFPAQEAHDLGQQVVVAESDGVVRQGKNYKIQITMTKTTNPVV